MIFGFFKEKQEDKLRRLHDEALDKAMQAQLNGDFEAYEQLLADSKAYWQQLQELKEQDKG